jgi:hypothetical protein
MITSQQVLRIRGTDSFTPALLPWRRGDRPARLRVTRDGAVVVETSTATTRIAATHYSYRTALGGVERQLTP